MRNCTVAACAEPHYAKGFCHKHWSRWRRHGDPLIAYKRTAPLPPQKQCTVKNCDKPALAKGLCSLHWQRNKRHGDPRHARYSSTKRRHARQFLEEVALNYDGEDCLIWPYSRSGKGYARIHRQNVHRIICEYTHGAPPTPEHQARHLCGKGHLGCVAPRHVAWGSPSENQMDRIDHGTSNRGEQHARHKLTAQEVREIRRIGRRQSAHSMAQRLGVTTSTIYDILRRKSWAWLDI